MRNDLFLNYMTDSKEHVLEYFHLLDQHISEMTNPDIPYIIGNFERKVKDHLADKELAYNERLPADVLKEMSEYFRGTTRWHHPYVMNNIKTPVNLPAVVTAFHAMLLDPNLAGDTNCGQIAFAEFEVTKYLSQLVGWNWEESGGYFTFGGTSTLLNAVKVGINKAVINACSNGVDKNLFIISSQQGHSAHADVCNWLGLGSKSCVRIPVDQNYQMDIVEAEKIITERLEQGGKLATIIACGGTTIQAIVDPIDQIYHMRERIVKKFNLEYKPHIHVDSVVGWVWLFYKGYQYDDNPLGISQEALIKIQRMEELVSKSEYADSIGIDFHKTGFCPYASSLFLTKHRTEIHDLNAKSEDNLNILEYGAYSPSSYTLELSRSSVGSITALTTLKVLGVQGHRRLLGNIIEGSEFLMNGLDRQDEFEVINKNTNGTCILFIIKPPNNNTLYIDLPDTDMNEVITLAKYNYNFYLYILYKIYDDAINFFIDYSSGYEKIRNGFHMGVLKMQTFNPMLSEEKVNELIDKIMTLKSEYDQYKYDFNFQTKYKPKPMKLTYKNNKIK